MYSRLARIINPVYNVGMQSIQDIFDVWPSVSVMASELEQLPDTVSRWRKKQRIPVDVWPRLIETAARREVLITATQLMNMNADAPPRGRPRKTAAV
jgi:hypothetical protein